MHNELTRIECGVAGDISYLVAINAVCNDRLYHSGGYRDERNERLRLPPLQRRHAARQPGLLGVPVHSIMDEHNSANFQQKKNIGHRLGFPQVSQAEVNSDGRNRIVERCAY